MVAFGLQFVEICGKWIEYLVYGDLRLSWNRNFIYLEIHLLGFIFIIYYSR